MSGPTGGGGPARHRKVVAIVQSSYIPWRGYFGLIQAADEFVLLDEVQYTRRDWRNRNRIKTPQGARWLTIPVKSKGRYLQKISETRASDPGWAEKHWRTIRACYGRAAHFERYRRTFEELFMGCEEVFLSRINRRFLEAMCRILAIRTPLTDSADYELTSGKSERLVEICRQAGATDYLSGPAARDYLDEGMFAEAGVRVHWADYSGYGAYRQLHPPFDPALSIVDLILNEGPAARDLVAIPGVS